MIPNRSLSLEQGAIVPWGKAGINGNAWYKDMISALARYRGFSLTEPVANISEENLNAILYGLKGERIPMTPEDRKRAIEDQQRVVKEACAGG